MSSSGLDEILDVGEQRRINDELKRRTTTKKKSSLAASSGKPKPASKSAASDDEVDTRRKWTRVARAAGVSEEQQRKAVAQAIEVYSLLPAGSTYAQHRLKVLRKVAELLDRER